ncbi:sugar ABC transporter [Sorangium cellulosum]|uniref:Sugar ABC transporter n=1 Tax=Sorangium cellulosum TaxID=56 RepID=A0A2L0EJW7_SORCE|nr:substrate-binding domain-containing protein [Sorangium cellulosum]AUX39578.1 sugar ABC transporter [Sorangium cellulosum]
MVTGLDLHATLHRIVTDAVGTVPSAQRGSLLARDGEQLVYKASVGLAGVLASPLEVVGGAVPAAAIATLSTLDSADSARVMAAADWYREHLPGAPSLHLVPAGAVVVLTPVRVQGQTIGVLAVEQPGGQAPSGERWARLRALAASAGAALERRELYNDKARSAQEVRVLEGVLSAVAAQTSTHELVEMISKGIKSVQLRPEWRSVHLVLLSDAPAGGARGDAAAREIRIYHVPHRSPLAFWNNVRDGAVIAGRSVGVHVDVRNARADSAVEQRGILEDGIERGVYGIAVAPITPEVIEPAIRRAVKAGIPVVTIDTPPAEGSCAQAYIGTDNVAAGRLAAELMARLLPGGGKIGALTFWLSAINSRERVEAFRAAVSGTPLDLQPPAEDRFDIELGMRIAREAVRTGGIAGALGVCAENGLSWGKAARELGRAGELKIVAFDLLTDTLGMLREGTIHAALVQREHEMGYRAVRLVDDMRSKGVEAALAGLPTRAGSGGGAALRFIDTGIDVVTIERTPWSLPLSDYLALDANRKAAKRREQLPYESRAKELLLVTVDAGNQGYHEERAPLDARSMVGRVLSTARPIIVDTHSSELHDAPDVAEARRNGAHTLVGVPLLVGGSAFGVLVLESGRRGACSLDDLTMIERVVDTMAVAIENTQLVHRIIERTHELEHANRHQESLLDTIRELSSPVVPIARSILVMPIVGTMDAERSGRFIESMLQDITEHHARVVLVDVTGMAVVDAASVEHLLRAARAARLLGAEVVLVGITPAAARLMVEQGVDLGSLITRSTLELGFAYALSKTGGKIVYGRSPHLRPF